MKLRTIPTMQPIGNGAEALYQAEEARNSAINTAAKELAKVLSHTPEEYWEKTMPEALASILDSYEPSSSIAAAIGYLNRYGKVAFSSKDQVKTFAEKAKLTHFLVVGPGTWGKGATLKEALKNVKTEGCKATDKKIAFMGSEDISVNGMGDVSAHELVKIGEA